MFKTVHELMQNNEKTKCKQEKSILTKAHFVTILTKILGLIFWSKRINYRYSTVILESNAIYTYHIFFLTVYTFTKPCHIEDLRDWRGAGYGILVTGGNRERAITFPYQTFIQEGSNLNTKIQSITNIREFSQNISFFSTHGAFHGRIRIVDPLPPSPLSSDSNYNF